MSGRFALVAVNNETSDLQLPFNIAGLNVTNLTPWLTSATESLSSQVPVTVTNGTFTYDLPAMSVLTFAGEDPSAAPGLAVHLSGAAASLQLNGPAGMQYTLFSSTNLLTWCRQSLTTNPPTMPISWAETNAATSARFYRGIIWKVKGSQRGDRRVVRATCPARSATSRPEGWVIPNRPWSERWMKGVSLVPLGRLPSGTGRWPVPPKPETSGCLAHLLHFSRAFNHAQPFIELRPRDSSASSTRILPPVWSSDARGKDRARGLDALQDSVAFTNPPRGRGSVLECAQPSAAFASLDYWCD